MTLQTLALKEPISLVSRCLPAHSSPKGAQVRKISSTNLNTATNGAGQSKVLTALDAHMYAGSGVAMREEDNGGGEDMSIEIVGPFRVALAPSRVKNKDKERPKERGTLCTAGSVIAVNGNAGEVQRMLGKPVHPFFLDAAAGSSSGSGSKSTSTGPVRTLTRAAPANIAIPIRRTNPKSMRPGASAPNMSTATIVAGAGCVEGEEATSPVALPRYSYTSYTPTPSVVYTRHEEEADDLVGALRGPISLDTEWRVIFKRAAPERRTAVVQVADAHMVLVVQVHGMGKFPQKLIDLIESKDVVKMGVNILNDGKKLFRDYGILARNLVELGRLAKQADPSSVQAFVGENGPQRGIISLAKVVERYCGKKLAKGKERTGNWEAELDQKQINYAANDAHCGLMVYKKLMDMVEENGVTLVPEAYTSHVRCGALGLASDSESESESASEMGDSASATTSKRLDSAGALEDAATTKGKVNSGSVLTPAMQMAGMRPQHLRAYRYWHVDGMTVERMCRELSLKCDGEPLKVGTVISYVIGALQADSTLPFEMKRLRKLVQMESGSWERHRAWILKIGKC